MKFLAPVLVVACALLLPSLAEAKKETNRKPASDSSWLVCGAKDRNDMESKSGPVLNIFEHRDGADTRKTEVYMIFGMHLFSGSFNNTNSDEGQVSLVSVMPKVKDTYTGKVKVDYTANKLTIKGGWVIDGESMGSLNYDMKCEAMN